MDKKNKLIAFGVAGVLALILISYLVYAYISKKRVATVDKDDYKLHDKVFDTPVDLEKHDPSHSEATQVDTTVVNNKVSENTARIIQNLDQIAIEKACALADAKKDDGLADLALIIDHSPTKPSKTSIDIYVGRVDKFIDAAVEAEKIFADAVQKIHQVTVGGTQELATCENRTWKYITLDKSQHSDVRSEVTKTKNGGANVLGFVASASWSSKRVESTRSITHNEEHQSIPISVCNSWSFPEDVLLTMSALSRQSLTFLLVSKIKAGFSVPSALKFFGLPNDFFEKYKASLNNG